MVLLVTMDYRLKAILQFIPKDKLICTICKKQIDIENLAVHHKDGKRYNSDPSNLELRCKRCHRNVTSETMIITNYKFPANLLKVIDEKAQELQISNSAVVRGILYKYFELESTIEF